VAQTQAGQPSLSAATAASSIPSAAKLLETALREVPRDKPCLDESRAAQSGAPQPKTKPSKPKVDCTWFYIGDSDDEADDPGAVEESKQGPPCVPPAAQSEAKARPPATPLRSERCSSEKDKAAAATSLQPALSSPAPPPTEAATGSSRKAGLAAWQVRESWPTLVLLPIAMELGVNLQEVGNDTKACSQEVARAYGDEVLQLTVDLTGSNKDLEDLFQAIARRQSNYLLPLPQRYPVEEVERSVLVEYLCVSICYPEHRERFLDTPCRGDVYNALRKVACQHIPAAKLCEEKVLDMEPPLRGPREVLQRLLGETPGVSSVSTHGRQWTLYTDATANRWWHASQDEWFWEQTPDGWTLTAGRWVSCSTGESFPAIV